jgi:RiboL-PSP-HEPN
MPRPRKHRPIRVFEQNVEDARQLLQLAEGLTNYRVRRMRRELRDAVGDALRYRKKDREALDCVESDDAFLIIKPDSDLTRDAFTEESLRPLTGGGRGGGCRRTYVADRAAELVGDALKSDPVPKRLSELAVSLGDVIEIESRYQRRAWGYRQLVVDHIRREASAASSKVGQVFSTVGIDKLWAAVDKERGLAKGTSARQLDALAARRNSIAHSADWNGARRASLTLTEVDDFYKNAWDIVEAIDKVV